jgi:glutathione S-transferase
MSLPLLYSGTRNASSWAMRAWLALREAGIQFEERIVDIRRPLRFQNIRFLRSLSPSATVPLLVVEGTVLFDSFAIMEFANDRCGGALLPRDSLARGRARSLLAWQHAGLSQICARISFESAFYPAKRKLTTKEQREGDGLFDHLELALAASGGPFLFGSCSLADLALVPTIVRLTRHDITLDRHSLAQRWSKLILDLPSVMEWMTAADDLPPIWFDDYLLDEDASEWNASAAGLVCEPKPAVSLSPRSRLAS